MRVLVFGGTHGNEWTGIMAVSHYAGHFRKKYPELELEFILANPEAYKINKRFKDEDLNRAFQFLGEDRPLSFEHERAKVIKGMIDSSPCFVIDLHTTTSNMGSTVILAHTTDLNLQVAARLKDCRIISSPDPVRKYLAGQSDNGLMIEVGPVANGVVNATALEATIHVLDQILSALTLENANLKGELEVFEEIEDVFYPKNEKGEISAYIHSELQGKDFLPLKGIYKAFQNFDGETILLNAKEELYPIFINEAAYYPSKLAFTLCRKILKKH